jgi:hypothetical protein
MVNQDEVLTLYSKGEATYNYYDYGKKRAIRTDKGSEGNNV